MKILLGNLTFFTSDAPSSFFQKQLTLSKKSNRFFGFLVIILLQFCAFLTYSQFTAPVSVPIKGFRIQGTLKANNPSPIGDWLADDLGNGGHVLNNLGVPLDPLKTYHITDLFNDVNDVQFTGSKYFDDPSLLKWQTGKPSGKTDINHALLHLGKDPSTSHLWAVFAGDRKETNGTSYIDFEFLQSTVVRNIREGSTNFDTNGPNGGRTVNDILVTVEYSGGGGTVNIFYYKWQASGTGFDYVEFTPPAGTGFGFTSNLPTAVPYGAFGSNTYNALQFV